MTTVSEICNFLLGTLTDNHGHGRIVNMAASTNESGDLFVEATIIGQSSPHGRLSVEASYGNHQAQYIDSYNGNVAGGILTINSNLRLQVFVTETARLSGLEAPEESETAYTVRISNAAGGDLPAGLELSFDMTHFGGANLPYGSPNS